MKLLTTLAVLILASTSLATPTTQPAYGAAHRSALQLLTDHQYVEARDAFTQLTKDNPNDAAAFCGLGTSLLYLGIDKDAAYALERAKLLNPADPATISNLVVARMRVGDYEKATQILTAFSQGHELTESLVDVWITAAVKLDRYPDSFMAAVARLEATRPGSKKWGVAWVSEDQFRQNQQRNLPLGRQMKELRRTIKSLEDQRDNLAGRLAKAKRDVATGGSNEEERQSQRNRVSNLEYELRKCEQRLDSAIDSLAAYERQFIPIPVLYHFEPVLPQ